MTVKALAGRDIIILQDNDDAGAKKALAAARAVGVDAKTGEAIFGPHILWEDNHVDVTAAEAMATAKSPAARDEAKKFLTDTLANGPVLKAEIEDAADANGISERTLFRAKGELGVMARKDGPNGTWTWRLPEGATKNHGVGGPRRESGSLGSLEGVSLCQGFDLYIYLARVPRLPNSLPGGLAFDLADFALRLGSPWNPNG